MRFIKKINRETKYHIVKTPLRQIISYLNYDPGHIATLLATVLRLISKLSYMGAKVFIVGGFIRDIIINRGTIDCDLATPSDMSIIYNALTALNIHSVLTNKKYHTISFEWRGIKFELTHFRKDIQNIDGKHHTNFYFITEMAPDAIRRDFTQNSLYLDNKLLIYDTCGGLGDILKKRIKYIGDRKKRLMGDSIRLLRELRFLVYNKQVLKERKRSIELIKQQTIVARRASVELIWKELVAIFMAIYRDYNEHETKKILILFNKTYLLNRLFISKQGLVVAANKTEFPSFDLWLANLLSNLIMNKQNATSLQRANTMPNFIREMIPLNYLINDLDNPYAHYQYMFLYINRSPKIYTHIWETQFFKRHALFIVIRQNYRTVIASALDTRPNNHRAQMQKLMARGFRNIFTK
jgi:tRNA nucleotidyltransferase/poly(A) polymerase